MYATPFEIEITSICAGTPVCQEVLLGAAAGVLVYKGVQAGIKIYQARKRDIRQFDDAIKKIQRRCGRPLSPDEQRQLHDEIHGMGLDFQGIVQWGVEKFCPGH